MLTATDSRQSREGMTDGYVAGAHRAVSICNSTLHRLVGSIIPLPSHFDARLFLAGQRLQTDRLGQQIFEIEEEVALRTQLLLVLEEDARTEILPEHQRTALFGPAPLPDRDHVETEPPLQLSLQLRRPEDGRDVGGARLQQSDLVLIEIVDRPPQHQIREDVPFRHGGLRGEDQFGLLHSPEERNAEQDPFDARGEREIESRIELVLSV